MPLSRTFGSKVLILRKIATLLKYTLVKMDFFFKYGKTDGFIISKHKFRIESLP